MSSLGLHVRRALSPTKLQAARLAAGFTNVSALARQLTIDRTAYINWETAKAEPLTYLDYVAMANALRLFGVTYEDVTDPLPEKSLEEGSKKRKGSV